jgi:hypothetical protein
MAAALPQPVPPSAVEPRLVPAAISSPEFDLLLACCVGSSNNQRSERISEALGAHLDWRRLIELAEHHGVVPHVYRRLAASDLVPAHSLEALQQHYETNARQTLWLTRELLHMLGHLESRGIQALPYKGPVLAELLYSNVAFRQFSDLDVLIRVADVPKVKSALFELGYESGIELTQQEERAYLASGYEYTFDSVHGRNLLETQWQVLPRFYSVGFDVKGFFDRAAAVSVGGHSLPTLCAEDLVLVLCVHAAKHVWMQLSWLCDIAELVRSQRLDWDAVQAQAKQLGIERIVAVTCSLAHKMLGAPVPPPLQAQMQEDGEIASLADEILPIIARSEEYDTESIPYFRLMMRLRERWQDRVRFLWRLMVTPSMGEWSAIRLPAPLFPFYRLVRLCRLVGRFIP